MKGIKENKVWTWGDVRSLCIRNEWYTRGTCQQYDELKEFIETHKPTTANIYKAAEDIYYHSRTAYDNDYTKAEHMQNIMFQISEDAVHTFYEIEEV